MSSNKNHKITENADLFGPYVKSGRWATDVSIISVGEISRNSSVDRLLVASSMISSKPQIQRLLM